MLGEIGLPAGLTRVMTKESHGWIDPVRRPGAHPDQSANLLGPGVPRRRSLLTEAIHSRTAGRSRSLEHRGFTQEILPMAKLPIAYDYDRLESVAVTKWRGQVDADRRRDRIARRPMTTGT